MRVTIASKLSDVPNNCDLYFSWWASGSIIPLIKAKVFGKPIIVVAGGNEVMRYVDSVDGTPRGYLSTPWYKKVATRLTLRLADRVLVVSNFMTHDVVSMGCSNPIVVHNSIDTDRFQPDSTKPREFVTTIFNLDRATVRLKRGEIFLRAIPEVLRRFPSQLFIVIGRFGDDAERLLALAKQLGIAHAIEFVGLVDNERIVEWMQRSQVYVQISDTETFGVSVAEAMSCETPIVVSSRGAIPEVAGELGVRVDHNDPLDVARGIISALSMAPVERAALERACRARIVDLFDFRIRKARIRKIISELLDSH